MWCTCGIMLAWICTCAARSTHIFENGVSEICLNLSLGTIQSPNPGLVSNSVRCDHEIFFPLYCNNIVVL